MPLGSASDIAFMLRDAGDVDVTYNGVTSPGIRDIGDMLEQTGDGGMVQVRATTILVATDAFEDLRQDGRLVAVHRKTKVSTAYRIDRVSPEDDGDLTRLYVAKAS